MKKGVMGESKKQVPPIKNRNQESGGKERLERPTSPLGVSREGQLTRQMAQRPPKSSPRPKKWGVGKKKVRKLGGKGGGVGYHAHVGIGKKGGTTGIKSAEDATARLRS